MNTTVLNTENQEFINKHLNSNIADLVLRARSKSSEALSILIDQIEAKKKCFKKLPTWYQTKNIYYPNKLNIEQTSSELTAKYKAQLVAGKSLIDLTGGFGVDCFYFSKVFQNVVHCEINQELSEIVRYNYSRLKVDNIDCIAKNGLEVLEAQKQVYDCIYIDPSRRHDSKGKVFRLNDCLPNVPLHLEQLFTYTDTVLIKTSPLLDLSIGIEELKQVKTIYSLAVNNEVKELIWLLKKGYKAEVQIKAVNLLKESEQNFEYTHGQDTLAQVEYSPPLKYLYEPNAAILKAGAFNSIAEQLNVYKLHKHAHLYTSEYLIDFPGRRFKVKAVMDYNKKQLKKQFQSDKANITTRHFPESVQNIRKKLALKEGGSKYLFFTSLANEKRIVISCSKVI